MYSLGNGNGFSVQEVIDVVKNVVAKDGNHLTVKEGGRRAGDPAILVADATKDLNWQPSYNKLDTIIEYACAWEKQQAC
ncbi:MAG: hypothetical protein U9N57_10420 [Pseudomonadota bacterium]|nr:hypothetical protein [Pseudomonadota bacterium]